jgi:hypothetical protein
MLRFLAHWLIILAAWTLTIKFAFPIIYDMHYGHAPGTHIYWDFWWVVHLALAWALLTQHRHYRVAGIAVSVIEIAIIVVKFVYFLRAPEWTIWQTNWFINKAFVLSCFVILLLVLLRSRHSSAG